MSDTQKPDPCQFDRGLGMRVTRRHRDDCTTNRCQGCAPCTAPHCLVCGREHSDNDHPQTCPKCQGMVTTDLRDIRSAYALLAREALEAGNDGHLVAAAPIPGGTAAVMIGPTVRLPLMRTYRGWTAENFADDHPVSKKTGRPSDPLPPLAVLAQWEDIYRDFLGASRPGKATIGRAIAFLLSALPDICQRTDGPDFVEFTRQIRTLRASCERALHNEKEPEQGVECFECGDKLVRRHRRATPCKHPTPARDWVRLVVSLGYPEILTMTELRALRVPCGQCNQGGVDNPSAGLSWECPSCRKEYAPGEYSNAVRRDLLEHGADGDGWTHISMAAEAASTLVGMMVPDSTVRKWMDRGKVSGMCAWTEGVPWGARLVYWPDVADEAVEAVVRHQKAAEARARRAEREEQERQAKEAEEAAKAAAKAARRKAS